MFGKNNSDFCNNVVRVSNVDDYESNYLSKNVPCVCNIFLTYAERLKKYLNPSIQLILQK